MSWVPVPLLLKRRGGTSPSPKVLVLLALKFWKMFSNSKYFLILKISKLYTCFHHLRLDCFVVWAWTQIFRSFQHSKSYKQILKNASVGSLLNSVATTQNHDGDSEVVSILCYIENMVMVTEWSNHLMDKESILALMGKIMQICVFLLYSLLKLLTYFTHYYSSGVETVDKYSMVLSCKVFFFIFFF